MLPKSSPKEIEMYVQGSKPPSEEKLLNASNSDSNKLSTLNYALIILFSIVIKVLQPLAIQNSKDSDGKYKYNESTMVLLVEIVKLIFCSFMFYLQYRSAPYSQRDSLHNLPFRQSLHFLVPAILYAASNTLVYIGMSYISSAFFHVFGNIRILTAGILYRIMMNRKQTDIQWLSMILIAVGALISSSSEDDGESENPFLGFIFITAMTVFSTSASIYTEKYFKKTQEVSIFYQNTILYSYGILVNIIVLIFRNSNNKGVFEGFDSAGFLVLLVQSTMGVSLSFIFKYLDNIVYVISLVVSMFLTAIVTTMVTDFSFSMNFVTALFVVTIGIYLFYRSKIFEKFEVQESKALF